jgi:RHS repeat-associated protein
VVARHDYEPFGTPVTAIGTDPKIFAHLFHDEESQLEFAQARQLQARTGRFTAIDAVHAGLFDPQRWNRYAYAKNNPVTFIDPTGLNACADPCFRSGVTGHYPDDGFWIQMQLWWLGMDGGGGGGGGTFYSEPGGSGGGGYTPRTNDGGSDTTDPGAPIPPPQPGPPPVPSPPPPAAPTPPSFSARLRCAANVADDISIAAWTGTDRYLADGSCWAMMPPQLRTISMNSTWDQVLDSSSATHPSDGVSPDVHSNWHFKLM